MFSLRTLTSLALTAVFASSAFGALLVAPGAWATTEGPTNNTFPFGSSAVRYQQVFAASEFASVGGPLIITAMRFRRDGTAGSPFTDNITWDVTLSTTGAAPDAMNLTFANNIGADVVTVFTGTQAFNASSTAGPPRDFEAPIVFTNPFTYNPANGNLLWDVTRFSTNVSHPMDAVGVTGDSVSRLRATTTTATMGTADSVGIIVQFEYSPVPEPATIAVLGIGALALVRRRRR